VTRRKGAAAGVRAAVVTALVVIPLAACTFERRPDPRTSAAAEGAERSDGDSIRAVITALDDARRRGDLAAALTLFDTVAHVTPMTAAGTTGGQAPWLNPEEALGAGWTPGSPGHPDPGLLESRVEFLAAGSALVLNRYGDTTAGASETLETVVLVRRPSGWRIRHLHRSAPPPNPVP
jgi:ketosteroid isomerase-like protein